MRRLLPLLLLAAAPGRQALGVFESWGAFRDAAPARCYAIAEPVRGGAGGRAFASVATWPGRGARNQLHVRLRAPRQDGAAVTLAIGERRWRLLAGAVDAWAPDARADAAIVAAMRSGRSLSVETRRAAGGAMVDVYALRGAATAIDAAALGCAGKVISRSP